MDYIKRLMEESRIIENAIYKEEDEEYNSNDGYSYYHRQTRDWYSWMLLEFWRIVDFKGKTSDEFDKYVSKISLTREQIKEIEEVRKEPMFKKLMGETALQQKSELESNLGVELTLKGKTIAFGDGQFPIVTLKKESQLMIEYYNNIDILTDLFKSNKKNEKLLNYIHNYFLSISKGEQIPFREISDEEYKKIRERAEDNGISFAEQLLQETIHKKYEHKEFIR